MPTSSAVLGRIADAELVPTTFEALGHRLGFTMPALAETRVRRGADGRLEVLTDALSGGDGVYYVMAWEALPAVMRLEGADRRLYAAINRSGARHPLQFREAADRLAGAEGADRKQRAATLEWLVQQLLIRLGCPDREAANGVLELEDADVRHRLGRIGRMTGVPPARLTGCLAELAGLLAPVGPDRAGRGGVLRTVWQQLHHLQKGAEAMGPDTAGPLLARTIAATLRECAGPIALIDNTVANLPAVLTGWEHFLSDLDHAVERLSWLLTGWERLTASIYEEGAQVMRGQTGFAVARLLPQLPLVAARRGMAVEKPFAASRDPVRRRVGQAEDWRTGVVDAELHARLRRSSLQRQGAVRGIREPRIMWG